MKQKILRIFFSNPGGFFECVFLVGREKERGDQGFHGAFCLAEIVSQKLVFDALNYMIITCSLILRVCHV